MIVVETLTKRRNGNDNVLFGPKRAFRDAKDLKNENLFSENEV